jgi:hypothetical protein
VRSTGQVEQLAGQDQVLPAGQVLVDRGVLAGQPDRRAHLAGLGGDVVPVDPRGARVGLGQRRHDPHGGGLAGAVGAEYAEDLPGRYGEVDPASAWVSPNRLLRPVASIA